MTLAIADPTQRTNQRQHTIELLDGLAVDDPADISPLGSAGIFGVLFRQFTELRPGLDLREDIASGLL